MMNNTITIPEAIKLLEKRPFDQDAKKIIKLLKVLRWQPITLIGQE